MSGGLLTIWKEGMVEVLNSFKGECYLGTKVLWMGNIYYVVNVYSSCDLSKMKQLWSNLLELKETYKDGEWTIGGDFNATKNSRERKGRMVVESNDEMKSFS